MSRKQDVMILFEFLIELLKEKEVVIETPKLVEEPVTPKPAPTRAEESKSKIEKLINPEDVRQLMQRVDEMDKPVFSNPILGDQQRNFEVEFKKMVKQVDELTKEKELNDKNNELDFTAESDFNIINKGRKNGISSDEYASVKPGYAKLKEIMDRAKSGISFSG